MRCWMSYLGEKKTGPWVKVSLATGDATQLAKLVDKKTELRLSHGVDIDITRIILGYESTYNQRAPPCNFQ